MNKNKGPFSTIGNAITTVLTGGLSYVLRGPSEQTVQNYQQAAVRDDRYNAEVARAQAAYDRSVAQQQIQTVPAREPEPRVLARELQK